MLQAAPTQQPGGRARLSAALARALPNTRLSSRSSSTANTACSLADELFRGTLAQTCVYPREVVKAALAHNAAAVIFAHNHPSGVAEPSRADELLTHRSSRRSRWSTSARSIISSWRGSRVVSFAERGLL